MISSEERERERERENEREREREREEERREEEIDMSPTQLQPCFVRPMPHAGEGKGGGAHTLPAIHLIPIIVTCLFLGAPLKPRALVD